jgi:hypothetical protein
MSPKNAIIERIAMLQLHMSCYHRNASFKNSIPFRSSAHKENVKIIRNNPDFLFLEGDVKYV